MLSDFPISIDAILIIKIKLVSRLFTNIFHLNFNFNENNLNESYFDYEPNFNLKIKLK